MKLLPTRVHGVLDYLAAGAFVVAPQLGGATKVGRRVMYGFAAATTLYSALTRYELSVAKVIPMRAHLALDALSGTLLIGTAFSHKSSSRVTLVGLGLFQILAALTTETEPSFTENEHEGATSVVGALAERLGVTA
ncbi:MAG: hypothetical protein H0X24_25235 [Ktedonobacterales bacterium]|nr:hypothetical protein [Ktedonobacterales bacterium]